MSKYLKKGIVYLRHDDLLTWCYDANNITASDDSIVKGITMVLPTRQWYLPRNYYNRSNGFTKNFSNNLFCGKIPPLKLHRPSDRVFCHERNNSIEIKLHLVRSTKNLWKAWKDKISVKPRVLRGVLFVHEPLKISFRGEYTPTTYIRTFKHFPMLFKCYVEVILMLIKFCYISMLVLSVKKQC